MRRWILCIVFCHVFIAGADAVLAAPHESAQESVSQVVIRGRVVDPTSGAIVGAQVTVTPERPGTPTTTVTNQRGEFELTLLPGSYTVRVSANGFVETSRRTTLTAGSPTTEEFTLAIAGIQESVSVGATIGYSVPAVSSATKTTTPLRDVPQAVNVVTRELIADQRMASMADVTRYMPKKKAALECYASQIDRTPSRSIDACMALARFRGSQNGCDYAEAFKVVRIVV
jgi:hypothetical protein